MKKIAIEFIIIFACTITSSLVISCMNGSKHSAPTLDSLQPINDTVKKVLVERVDTLSLILLFPKFNHIDLVCETMPSKRDSSVLLCAEACFTGELLNEFTNSNIAGDHVSNGKRFHGYKCKRNTGAFVFYQDHWEFLYKNYSDALDKAAQFGGCGFGQEMIIHKSKFVKSIRKNNNKNQFRALCEIDSKLCIAESSSIVSYTDFKNSLLNSGVTEALYLDMGSGWNHAWYRSDNGAVVELHPKTHNFCTNWITFYKE